MMGHANRRNILAHSLATVLMTAIAVACEADSPVIAGPFGADGSADGWADEFDASVDAARDVPEDAQLDEEGAAEARVVDASTEVESAPGADAVVDVAIDEGKGPAPDVRGDRVDEKGSVDAWTMDATSGDAPDGPGRVSPYVWIRQSPAASPSPRATPLIYDSFGTTVTLFGGVGPGAAGDRTWADTWTWDGTTWIQQFPASSPPSRGGHALAYDFNRRKVVLFGGYSSPNSSTFLADTWEWDGRNWTQRFPAKSPSPRHGHALAFDTRTNRNKTVLFGGITNVGDAGPSVVNDTWEWDGTDWTMVVGATSGSDASVKAPPARAWAAMAFDPQLARVVLFGGSSLDQQMDFDDTWEWDGASWTGGYSPGPAHRTRAALDFDERRRRLILFGGTTHRASGTEYQNDVWQRSYYTWQSHVPEESPSPRESSIAFDYNGRRLVLFGGRDQGGYLGDTWEYHTRGESCYSFFDCLTQYCSGGVCCETECAAPNTCSPSGVCRAP